MERYPLAPMSGLILWLTLLVLPLPLLMLWIASATGMPLFWIPALFIAVIYLFVWLYMRPSRFELGARSLEVVWPLRRLSVPLGDVEKVERLTYDQFRARFGYGVRIGAGGLWGAFGLFKTKSVTFQFYISRMDDYVILWRRSDRPLLITPDEPDRFADAIGARIG